MKEIEEGDLVKFLNDTDTGVVISIIDKDMVLVRTDEDGFEYPVLKTELLVRKTQELEELEDLPAGQTGVEELEELEDLPAGQTGVEELEDLPAGQAGVERVEKNRKLKNSGIEEVDLHIKEIIDDTEGLTSGEIVEIQLARFRTALEGAIRAKQNKIIFIHGKGAGKLKYEIQKIITNEYNKCRYQDASFREYGYGATLILIS